MSIDSEYNKYEDTNISIFEKKNRATTKKIVFMDRDGVMIEDVDHIKNEEDVVICEGLNNLLSYLKDRRNIICVVTNQSSVARGIIDEDRYEEITEKMLSFLDNSNQPEYILTSFYHEAYSQNKENSNWRKPGVGMFEYIKKKIDFDMESAVMIGDKLSDLRAASDFGIQNLIHIESAIHRTERIKIRDWEKESETNVHYINHLDEALMYV